LLYRHRATGQKKLCQIVLQRALRPVMRGREEWQMLVSQELEKVKMGQRHKTVRTLKCRKGRQEKKLCGLK
ncbi:MAG: hypothetical protein K2G19_13505, partial [Lachnospiraceae bacterium]|nr:hypothetical protein [Lachnospiraceae bacterium]